MAAGLPVTKELFDRQLGALIMQVRDGLDGLADISTWVTENEAEYTAFGYSQADDDRITAALAALVKLRAIANGQDTQAVADDFFFHARRLIGLN